MSALNLPSVLSRPLTNAEFELNFTRLNADKYEAGASPTFVAIGISGAYSATANSAGTYYGAVVTNSNAGAAAVTAYRAINDGGAAFEFGMLSSGYTTAGGLIANAAYLLAGNAAGIAMVANAGPIVFCAGGTAEKFRVSSVSGVGAVCTGLLDLSPATSGRIKFPATQNASADADTLDDYREGTYTGTATGMTTSPTQTFKFVKTGAVVTLEMQSGLGGTSNSTAFTVTGMPAAIRPATSKRIPVRVQDNGGPYVASSISVDSAGVLTIFATANDGAFTAAGSKGLADFSASYSVL